MSLFARIVLEINGVQDGEDFLKSCGIDFFRKYDSFVILS